MTKLKDRPFALLGVNINGHEPSALEEVMAREKLDWRSFADQGAIYRSWNSPPTPTFYVLDHEGVIRHKWIGSPGEKAIDDALDELLRQVEKSKR